MTDMHCSIYGKETLCLISKKEKAACYSDGGLQDLCRKETECGVNTFALMNGCEKTAPAPSFYAVTDTEGFEFKINEIKAGGHIGVCVDPQALRIPADSLRLAPVYEASLSNGLMLCVRSARLYDGYLYCSPKRLAAVADRYEGAPVILSHLGGIRKWDRDAALLCEKDVYFDTAACTFYQTPGLIRKIISEHGADKILFGSDMPWCTPSLVLAFLNFAGTGAKELEMITQKNAEKLLSAVTARVSRSPDLY